MKNEAYIVTLNEQGRAPRAAYGPFLWSTKHGRYIWRGEIATTLGQLAELFTQAAAFLREQENYFLILGALSVPASEAAPELTPGPFVALGGEVGRTKDKGQSAIAAPEHAEYFGVEWKEKAPEAAAPEEVKLPRKLRSKKTQPQPADESGIPSVSPFETEDL